MGELELFTFLLVSFILVVVLFSKHNQTKSKSAIAEDKQTQSKNTLVTTMIPNSVIIDKNYLPNLKNKKYGYGKRFNAFVCDDSVYYHKSKCPKLKNKKKTVIHRYVALQNYKPCPVCSPIDYIDPWYMEFLKKNWNKVTDTTYQDTENNRIKDNLPLLLKERGIYK